MRFLWFFPASFSWVYVAVAVISLFVHFSKLRRRARISLLQWLFAAFNAGYLIFFVLSRLISAMFMLSTFVSIGLVVLLLFWLLGRRR